MKEILKNIENRSSKRTRGLLLAGLASAALLAFGCGESQNDDAQAKETSSAPKSKVVAAPAKALQGDIIAAPPNSPERAIKDLKYFKDGSRTYVVPKWHEGIQISVKQVCVSPESIETHSVPFNNSNGFTMDISDAHGKCLDMHLSPDEFEPGEP